MIKSSKFQRLFEEARYREVIDGVSGQSKSFDDLSARIGALAFSGQMVEAQALWRVKSSEFNVKQRVRSRFCLAIALTRTSKLNAARILLRENLKEATDQAGAEIFQGVAFYFYFIGKYRSAFKWASKALDKAIATNDPYIEILALDILSHCEVQLGKLSAGLRHFEETISKASHEGYQHLIQAFKISKLTYESEAGYRPESILMELSDFLKSLALQDSYSRANIGLEMARQEILRGQWNRAEATLNSTANLIYSYENRRQEIRLQIHLAELAYRRGDFTSALHFLRSARRSLEKVTDRIFEIRVLGFELKIHHQIQNLKQRPIDDVVGPTKISQIDEIETKLLALTKEFPSRLNFLILARELSNFNVPNEVEKDPIFEVMEILKKGDSSESEHLLIQRGYLGLLPSLKKFEPGKEILYVNRDNYVVTQSRLGIYLSSEKLSNLQGKVLRILEGGTQTKENLIIKVWGYTYDSLRHDSLVYATIGGLRKSLGSAGDWIQTTEDGWKIQTGVIFVDEVARVANALASEYGSQKKIKEELPNAISELHLELNYRQMRALEELQKHRGAGKSSVWTIDSYRNFFKASTMTSWRDLNDLVKKGYLFVRGKGKNTTYHRFS